MGERLYNRAARLTLLRPAPTGFFDTLPNAVIIERLRMAYDVSKTLEAEPNTAIITVYNLAESTRASLQRKPLRVRLAVGYDGNLAQIFDGDARYVTTTYSGADAITKIECGDGERAFRAATLSRSYPKGVDARTVVRDLAGSMGLTVPTTVADALATSQYSGGKTISGPSEKQMGQVLAKHGYGYSIQDGKLQILATGAARTDVAHVIDESTGLVGSPEFGLEQGEGGTKRAQLKLRTLVYPAIVPGSRLAVTSRAVQGQFKADKVKHTGDTHAQPWYTEIEAVPL